MEFVDKTSINNFNNEKKDFLSILNQPVSFFFNYYNLLNFLIKRINCYIYYKTLLLRLNIFFIKLFKYHSSLNTVTYPDKLWHNNRVPYMLEEGMTDSLVLT